MRFRFYQLCERPGQEGLLAGIAPQYFDEALQSGSLGTLLVVTSQLYIKIRFKKKTTFNS
jgi:hypothetical protein